MQPRRVAATAAVAAVAIAALILMLGRGSYQVSLTLANASQLVHGDQVKVGGVPVGSVDSIGLTPDGRARLELSISDSSLTPLHEGTRAIVRSTSLAGIANRYVSLEPGPNNAPKISGGGQIPADDGTPEVDLDAVLNTLGPSAQRDLHNLIHASSGLITKNNERLANQGLLDLNPALSQSADTAREIAHDEAAFERFIVRSADVVSTVASRPADLNGLVDDSAGALQALANRSQAIDTTLAQLPDTLRATNTTLVNVRALIADLRPALRDAQPAAPLLSALLEKLSPLAHRALPVVNRLDHTAGGDLLRVVKGFVPLDKVAAPAFKSVHQTLVDLLPVVVDARPYAPEVIGGLVNGFGGTTSGYYDANGHYARISFQGGPYSLDNGTSFVPVPSATPGLTGYEKHVVQRCPGSATQPAPDKSNPWCP